MNAAVQVSDQLFREARIVGKVENRSIPAQIEYWAKIGRCAEENPGLTFNFIREILIGLEELEDGQGTEYEFG